MVEVHHAGFHSEAVPLRGAVWAEPFIIGIKPYTTVGGSGHRRVQKVELEIRGLIPLRND